MNLLSSLKRKYISNVMDHDPRFVFTRTEQEKIINKYSNPRDLIERSFYQYKVQKRMLGSKALLYDLASPLITLMKLVKASKKGDLRKKCDLVCSLAGIKEDLVPLELLDQYQKIEFYQNTGEEYLGKIERRWFFQNIVKRYPFSFFFHVKILSRLCNYGYMIVTYSPDAIANHCEYSCGSSAMTQYCHDRGIKHINFMHGEKPYYIRDSFFAFDECYVWNEHYKKMFVELKAEENQFVVAIPPQFTKALNEEYAKQSDIKHVDYCYYLANEPHEQLTRIFNALLEMKEDGHSCRVRLHPRWGDHDYIYKLANEMEIAIEEQGVDINDSILSTEYAISLFSTVLFQSHILGTKVVIDDISSPDRFNMLKELDYVAFSLPHFLLSKLCTRKRGIE